MATLLQKLKNNRWWVAFVIIAILMIAGCGLFQPRTKSVTTDKTVTRTELRSEYSGAIAGIAAKEASLLAEKKGLVDQYDIAFEDLDIKAAQQQELISMIVPVAGPMLGPLGAYLPGILGVLFGVTAAGDKGRMNRALEKHNVAAGLAPDGHTPLVPPPTVTPGLG